MSKRFLLALLMPIILIAAVLSVIAWSKHLPEPTQDFLFTLTENPLCISGTYEIQQQHLVWHHEPKHASKNCESTTTPKLYRYNVLFHQAQELTFKEAKHLQLTTDQMSRDGFKVTNGNNSELAGILSLSPRSYNAYYLIGRNTSEIIQLPSEEKQKLIFNFVGWIQ